MKKNIGIWIDSKRAVVIKLLNNTPSIKKIASNIDIRERVPGENKKFGRFGGQFMTFEKNRKNRRNHQTNQFLKLLMKQIENCESVVIFGPSNMKNVFAKEIKKNMQLTNKLIGVANSALLTENQMVAWVKKFFDIPTRIK
jgi:hypothetical protein